MRLVEAVEFVKTWPQGINERRRDQVADHQHLVAFEAFHYCRVETTTELAFIADQNVIVFDLVRLHQLIGQPMMSSRWAIAAFAEGIEIAPDTLHPLRSHQHFYVVGSSQMMDHPLFVLRGPP
ncbi:hypothetical protein D3C80_800450 [compost metagenome]